MLHEWAHTHASLVGDGRWAYVSFPARVHCTLQLHVII